MSTAAPSMSAPRAVGVLRTLVGLAVIGILAYAYVLRFAAGDANPFDYFGYFTNQTSLFAACVLIAAGIGTVHGGPIPHLLVMLRAVATSYLIVVCVIYNVLVPGTGSAPPWVSATLHIALPVMLVADWILAPDRRPLPWRSIWIVLPYPLIWLVVVLLRGATDGWVPYGFLLPERAPVSLWLHIVGLVVAMLAAACVVWMLSRVRVRTPERASKASPPSSSPREDVLG